MNKTFTPLDLEWFERRIGPDLPTSTEIGVPRISGRLAQSLEGAGKRRIFAIGNYMNQRLLAPIHKWLAQVLRTIPMDGTFNQAGPLVRLKGAKEIFSFDLSSATDRWPLVIMFEFFQSLFEPLRP